MFCPHCGADITEDSALFCAECGGRLRDLGSPTPTTEGIPTTESPTESAATAEEPAASPQTEPALTPDFSQLAELPTLEPEVCPRQPAPPRTKPSLAKWIVLVIAGLIFVCSCCFFGLIILGAMESDGGMSIREGVRTMLGL